jgi:cell division protease FtsH
VPNPDLTGREAILRVHMKPVPLAVDVDVKVIARGTPGFSGADLANLVNEAALMAARKDRKLVTMRDFEDAKDKVMMGAERKSMAMSEDEKRNTAYHEGGHAIVALKTPQADPVHKATIIPRGRALGMVMQLPEGDRYSMNFTQMTSRLAIMMAGRVAEEIIMGKDNITSGASSDIQAATRLAKSMVTRWGFSDKLGFVDYKQGEDEYGALGRDTSEATQQIIDDEVKRLVNDGYEEAKRILTENLDGLHRLAKTLLDLETLTGDEIAKILNGEEIVRDEETGVAIELSSHSAVPETETAPTAVPVIAE